MKTVLTKIRHALAHVLGWNGGRVEAWYVNDALMVGFRCSGCGVLQHVAPAVSRYDAELCDSLPELLLLRKAMR